MTTALDSEIDPRQNPPAKWKTNILQITSAISMVTGTAYTILGSAALVSSNKDRGESFGKLFAGLVALFSGSLEWEHARYANKVRTANNVDKLLLQKLDTQEKIKQGMQELSK